MLWFADLEQPMTQRHGRGPAPLFKNGVLYSEGLHGIIAVDAYNGHKLWDYELPDILKSYDGDHLMGTSGTGSNYCVSEAGVFVRLENACLQIDRTNGTLIRRFEAPPAQDGGTDPWGYIAVKDGTLYGSLADPEHVVTYRYVNSGDLSGQLTESRSLFALDIASGDLRWRYDARHSIRHNAIALGGGFVVACAWVSNLTGVLFAGTPGLLGLAMVTVFAEIGHLIARGGPQESPAVETTPAQDGAPA